MHKLLQDKPKIWQNVSRCQFDFTRLEREMACINDVTESLKYCSKIYYVKRGENEVRVNDYKPLLLMLWRANMDLQYIFETSLTLTECQWICFKSREKLRTGYME